jgi:hypothetical protein
MSAGRQTACSTCLRVRTDSLLQAPPQRFVEIPREVGCRQHHHNLRVLEVSGSSRAECAEQTCLVLRFRALVVALAAAHGLDAVHLRQQLRLDTGPTCKHTATSTQHEGE